MCNRYQVTSNIQAITDLVTGWRWRGRMTNAPWQTDLFPNYTAGIVRLVDEELQIDGAIWGMPKPPSKNRTPGGKQRTFDSGVTNIRELDSGWWRQWIGVQHRCLVPMTRFTEPDRTHHNHGFEFTDGREVVMMAGMCTRAVRKVRDKDTEPYEGLMYAFLTSSPNSDVGEIHSKAMPVILDDPDDFKIWLTADFSIAKQLQKPLDDGLLRSAPTDPIPMDEGLNRQLGLL